MSESELDALLTRMPAIAEAVNAFASDQVQQEAFAALVSAFRGGARQTGSQSDRSTEPPAAAEGGTKSGARKASPPRKPGAKKQTYELLKDLDVHRGATPSLSEFVAEKAPQNQIERAAVFVYWLVHIGKVGTVTVNHVYTCYRNLNIQVPSDLVNTLQKAGSNGWLDTGNREDIRIVVGGDNFVEHQLPRPQK